MKRSLIASLLVMAATPVSAHVTANPNAGAAGSYFETAFRVSHGCAGTDTIALSVKMPPGIVTAKPQAKAGWTVNIKKSKLPAPVPAGHGRMADEQIDEIIWRGGTLPNDQYDTFGVLMKLPEKPGETLWFPITQTCVKGSHGWTQIPLDGQSWHDLESPAPYVKIDAAGHGHH